MELQSTGFLKVVHPRFFLCELCFPMCTFSHAFVSHYQNTPFPCSSLPVPAAVEQIQNLTVEEGRNVTKECNVTAGTPPLNVSWKNLKTGLVIKGKLLTIINIRRNQSGDYRCIANNTCGNESTGCSSMCIVRTYIMSSLGLIMFVIQC